MMHFPNRHFATRQKCLALIFLWSVFASISFYSLYGSPIDPGGMVRLFAAMTLGGVMLIVMIAFFTLVSKNAYTALGFLWLVFSLMATVALSDSPTDPGGIARIAAGAAMGAAAMVFMFVVAGLGYLLFDLLPSKIAYLRLSPIEKYAHRINSVTAKGRDEKARLQARLVTVATSSCLRETAYHDPKDDQHWLGAYWEADFYSGEDLKPIDRTQLERTLQRFQAVLADRSASPAARNRAAVAISDDVTKLPDKSKR